MGEPENNTSNNPLTPEEKTNLWKVWKRTSEVGGTRQKDRHGRIIDHPSATENLRKDWWKFWKRK